MLYLIFVVFLFISNEERLNILNFIREFFFLFCLLNFCIVSCNEFGCKYFFRLSILVIFFYYFTIADFILFNRGISNI